MPETSHSSGLGQSQIFRFSIFCAEATFGVGEIASAYYGQFLPMARTSLTRSGWGSSLFPCESVASVRITDYRQSRDKARRILRTS